MVSALNSDYFALTDRLAVKIHRSNRYWHPASFELSGCQGSTLLDLPRDIRDTYRLLHSSGFINYLQNPKNLIIGQDLKDLHSIFRSLGVEVSCRSLDVDLIRSLDALNADSYPESLNAQSLLFQVPWFLERLQREPLRSLYKHLIEGMFPVIAGIENTGVLTRGGSRKHTRYTIGGSQSGRLSCRTSGSENIFFNPHLISKRGGERENYIADPGCKMIFADETAMEMRVLAHLSDDPRMRSIFEQDLDIHDIIARLLFDKSSKDTVEEIERDIAKSIGFLMVYGGKAPGLAKRAKISIDRAEDLLNRFFRLFPRTREWILDLEQKCCEQGYIESVFGRIRCLNTRESLNSELRKCRNFCVQSPAADINSLALRGLYHLLPPTSKILFHIHDMGAIQAPDEDVEEVCGLIKRCMENPPGLNLFGITLKVPLRVKIVVSDEWKSV